MFPATIAGWVGQGESNFGWLQTIAASLSPGQPIYILLYGALIIFFCFFLYRAGHELARHGGQPEALGCVYPGNPAGAPDRRVSGQGADATDVLGCDLCRIGLSAARVRMILYWQVPFYFGGTSLLIIVVVVMDFMAQLQAHA